MPTMFPSSGVEDLVRVGGSCRVNEEIEPKFREGDQIVAANINPVTHTRLPSYIRGKPGLVVKDHGVFVFPDTNSVRKGETAQHVYSVEFKATDLWGADVNPRDKLYIDLWETYMHPAQGGTA
jgi:Nitrile hydratase beta subunit